MKNIFLMTSLWSLLMLLSCTSPKETIIDKRTGEKVVGFDKNCKYRIGKTLKSSFSETTLKELRNDSIVLVFEYASMNRGKNDVLLAAWADGHYQTSKGVKPGDPVEKAIKAYGKPKAKTLEYWRDENARIAWRFDGLFYENLAIITDSTKSVILGISVGKQFEIDKKYILE